MWHQVWAKPGQTTSFHCIKSPYMFLYFINVTIMPLLNLAFFVFIGKHDGRQTDRLEENSTQRRTLTNQSVECPFIQLFHNLVKIYRASNSDYDYISSKLTCWFYEFLWPYSFSCHPSGFNQIWQQMKINIKM